MKIKTILIITALTITGCAASRADRIAEVRSAADECRGNVKLQIDVSGETEHMKFSCEWSNGV